jgi:hypothetical protein
VNKSWEVLVYLCLGYREVNQQDTHMGGWRVLR